MTPSSWTRNCREAETSRFRRKSNKPKGPAWDKRTCKTAVAGPAEDLILTEPIPPRVARFSNSLAACSPVSRPHRFRGFKNIRGSWPMEVKIYDTTLRDGTQAEDFCFSAEDKVRIALKLDDIGIHYIEGGWPGSNPKDADFFREIRNYRPQAGQNCGFRLNSPSGFDRCLRSQPQGAARSKYRTGHDIRKKLDGARKRSPAHDPRAQPSAHFR